MAGIEAFLILTVAALHLAVVPWCVRSDQLMPDAQLRGCFLKQCRQVTPAIGETVGEFKPIVSLNALYLYSSAGVPRPQLAQEIRRRIGGLLRMPIWSIQCWIRQLPCCRRTRNRLFIPTVAVITAGRGGSGECRLQGSGVPCQRKDVLRTTLPVRAFSGIKKTRCSTTVPGRGSEQSSLYRF